MRTYESKDKRADYAPPLLGNGEMALQLDFMGQMAYLPGEDDTDACVRVNASPFVWLEGRRYVYDMRRFLIPFGRLLARVDGLDARPESWCQSLDPVHALMTAECRYAGAEIRVEAFVHHDINLLCVRRTFSGTSGRNLQLSCTLTDNKSNVPDALPRYMTLRRKKDAVTGGLNLFWSVPGQEDYTGCIRLFTDCPSHPEVSGNSFSLVCPAEGQVTFFMLLRDSVNESNWEAVSRRQAKDALQKGFDALFSEHARSWESYVAESRVNIADSLLRDAYAASRYDLGCYASRWSVPVGISDNTWEGKYFAYDEYFGFDALLTGGHGILARRVPEFRRSGLKQAISRMSSPGLGEARFPWETVETGEEAAIPGFWHDHVFHMANISAGAWEYYAYTLDQSYLRETAYPLLRACAEFYLRHMVYRVEGGKTVIGACTDWERLGSSVRNAFMTTCGVIQTLRLAARACNLLGEDACFAEEALETSDRLFAGLAVEEGRYVPHPGCKQRSIGIFGGLYPYAVTKPGDPFQAAAVEDFRINGGLFGNMYATGSGLSPWFASWIAIACARMGQAREAYDYLLRAAESCGCFGELYEINEPGKYYRPWFSTANGIFQAAVHRCLVDSRPEGIALLPGWPDNAGDIDFLLPAHGDLTVHLHRQGGKLTVTEVFGGEHCIRKTVTLLLPDGRKTEAEVKHKT